MEYLLEVYDDSGRCFKSWPANSPTEAMALLGHACLHLWNGMGFRNATCYGPTAGTVVWELEIKS